MPMTADEELPTERDLDPWNGYPDAQCAWQHFGGLTLGQAEARFRESPDYYQEDFMFMGGKAFAYYFPVIENYLRTIPDVDCDDDHNAWILAHCIRNQFSGDNLTQVRHLGPRVIRLAEFLREEIHRFGIDDGERQRVATAWTELVEHVKATADS
jgi:hypothetical protein